MIKAFFKLIAIAVVMSCFFVIQSLRVLFSKLLFCDSPLCASKITSGTCFLLFKIIGVRIKFENPPQDKNKFYLYISNHLSYLDVIIYSTYFPSLFVTSKEIKETPFLGQVCTMAACFFVERRNKKNLIREINALTSLLEKKIPVMIFPEATSTDGSSVLPFKSPLFKACVKKETPILPFSLNYKKIDQNPFDLSNRNIVCWYGDMPFLPHLWNMLRCRSIEATIVVSAPLYLPDHRQLAIEAHKMISSNYKPLVES